MFEHIRRHPDSAAAGATWIARLRRHLIWVLLGKFVLIAALYALFFSSSHRPDIGPSEVMQRISPAR